MTDAPDARLVADLDDPDPHTRRAAVDALARTQDPPVRTAAILTGYHDASVLVRRAAVEAAARLEDDEYRPLFEEAVDDPDPQIRWHAVRALRHLGVAPSLEKLMLAAVDDDESVRREAEAALADLD
jgi:HEAT repeat protein